MTKEYLEEAAEVLVAHEKSLIEIRNLLEQNKPIDTVQLVELTRRKFELIDSIRRLLDRESRQEFGNKFPEAMAIIRQAREGIERITNDD